MLALATGDLEEAAQWCSWCANFDFLPVERQTLYRAIHDLVELNLTGEEQEKYHASLRLFYDESVLDDAIGLVKGTSTFHGLTFADSWEKVSPTHQHFIGIYKRLHPLKSAAL